MALNNTISRLAALALVVALGATACSDDAQQPEPLFDPAAPAADSDDLTPSSEAIFEPADASTTSELTLALEAIVADTGVPGLGAASFTSDGVHDIGVAGLRKRDGSTPVAEDDLFHLGSNTKAMTAALVGRLTQQDLGLSFDTTLAEAFSGSVHVDYADVTLADLLTHTGGTPANSPDVDESRTVPEQRALIAAKVLEAAPNVEPHTVSRYSNTGYVIVGAALEAATGKSWEDLMRTELFGPLGMDSCGFGAPGDGSGDDSPLGHDPAGRPIYADNLASIGPAGTVHCSMADWGSFLSEILRGNRGESDLFDQDTIDRLLSTRDEPVENIDGARAGMGWMVFEGGPDGPAYVHDGSNTFWFSLTLLAPDLNIGALTVSNEASTGQQATGMALETLTEMYPGEPSPQATPSTPSSPDGGA